MRPRLPATRRRDAALYESAVRGSREPLTAARRSWQPADDGAAAVARTVEREVAGLSAGAIRRRQSTGARARLSRANRRRAYARLRAQLGEPVKVYSAASAGRPQDDRDVVALVASLAELGLVTQGLGAAGPHATGLLNADLLLAHACLLMIDVRDRDFSTRFIDAAQAVLADAVAGESEVCVRDRLLETMPPSPGGAAADRAHRSIAAAASGDLDESEPMDRLAAYRLLVDDALDAALLDDPVAVSGPFGRLVRAGGKRLRPLLALTTASVGRCELDRALKFATALELLHGATLVHDDYVDRSAYRRGQPTVITTEGPVRAIALADYYFLKAIRGIAELEDAAVNADAAVAIRDVCLSQVREFRLRGLYPPSRRAYLRIVRGKTASLFVAASVGGARLGAARRGTIRTLAEYGAELGIAFQMIDDALDFSRNSGKPVGQDIRERNLSLPLIYAAEHPTIGAEVRELLAAPPDEDAVVRVLDLVDGSGVLERVRNDARYHGRRAALRARKIRTDCSQTLLAIAEVAVERSS
jgi:heptaprenyl diphosphate synthase